MSSPHFGVIIQGPLDSRGFDTRPTILEYLAQADALPQYRFSFCLSTWRSAELGALAPAAVRLDPIFNEPPAGRDYENRRRQSLSAVAGAERLAASAAPDFLLKVRTDQRLSLADLAGHLVALQSEGALRPETVVVPGVYASIPYFVPDFYYGGATGAMLAFLREVERENLSAWQYAVEIDFMLKHLAALPGSGVSRMSGWLRRRQVAFSPWLIRGWVYRRYARAWQEDARRLRFFPRRVYAEMRWRGVLEPEKLHLEPDLLAHEQYAQVLAEPAGPESRPPLPFAMRLLLLGYTIELFVTALLSVQPLPVFFKLADRRRIRWVRRRAGLPPG